MTRRFLCSTLMAALVGSFTLNAADPIPAAARTNGWALGCQAWSFNKFSAFEAIEKTAASGAKCIEFFPGQKLSPEKPDQKLDHSASPEIVEAVQAKLKKEGITAVAYGVVGIPKDEAGARKVFEFAKKLGIKVINTESADAIDTIEKMVKEYDIKVGFHDHPKREKDPGYKMWDPNYILQLVKDRDPRIGSCADTGHWLRSGLKPTDCIALLKGHIVSSHFKDLHKAPDGHDVPWGTGVSDAVGQLKALKAAGFDGPLSVEYEHDWDNNLPSITKCVDFIKQQQP